MFKSPGTITGGAMAPLEASGSALDNEDVSKVTMGGPIRGWMGGSSGNGCIILGRVQGLVLG